MSKVSKVNLTLLKRLVSELEASIATAETIKTSAETSDGTNNEYIVEMSKAAGLAAGVMSESSMLIMDIQSLVTKAQAPVPGGKSDFLDKLMGGFKGPGEGKN
jgi:hypothetical protein